MYRAYVKSPQTMIFYGFVKGGLGFSLGRFGGFHWVGLAEFLAIKSVQEIYLNLYILSTMLVK